MSKEKEKKEVAPPSLLESELYQKVEEFFSEVKECETIGSASSNPISLSIFGGTIYPDVFGVKNPEIDSFRIYMAEGKLSFRGREFDICKGQAITLQRFADFVYVFFPLSAWNDLIKEEKDDVLSECRGHELGLLIVDKESCQQVLEPDTNKELLKQENRVDARDRIIEYFPNFTGSEENADFFEKYARLANEMTKESCKLLLHLTDVFLKSMPVKRQSVKSSLYEDNFEFYFFAELKNMDVFLIMNPFGSEVFDTKGPSLFVEEYFRSSFLRKEGVRQKLALHLDDSLRRKCRIDTEDMIFYSPDTPEDILKHIEEGELEGFSILEQVEILGTEKEKIKENVEHKLQKIVDFSETLEQQR